jgi:hypothetical protein
MASKPRKNYARKHTVYQDTPEGKVPIGWEFKWSDGSAPTRRLVSDLPLNIRAELICHGGKAKEGDHYNTASSIAEAKAASQDMWDRLCAGEFHIAKAGGAAIAEEWIIKAIAELKEKPIETIQLIWDSLSQGCAGQGDSGTSTGRVPGR